MKLPTMKSYYPYSSDNYGANSLVHNFEKLSLYYSYNTCVAYIDNGELVIRKNDWSTTTGKHLNAICSDKSIRIDGAEFETKLTEVLKKYKLS